MNNLNGYQLTSSYCTPLMKYLRCCSINGSYMVQNEVRIVDATAASFKEFLQFFYLDKVELTIENVRDVMCLDEKYGADDCLDLCADFMTTKLTDDNVCWAFEVAILFKHELRGFCMKLLRPV